MNIIKTEKGYYYKIYKNNKKKRVSKLEYEKFVKNGGSPNPHLTFIPSPLKRKRSESPNTVTITNNNNFNLNEMKQYNNNVRLTKIESDVIKELQELKKLNNTQYLKTKNSKPKSLKKTYKRNKIDTSIVNNNNKIIKNFVCYKKHSDSIKKILNEIIMHKFAIELTNEYNENNPDFKFKVPIIYNIYFSIDPTDYITIYIEMEKLNEIKWNTIKLNDKEIINSYDNIIKYLEFLRANGLFHNDTHRDNLFFINDGDYKMGLIDFGQSSTESLHASIIGIKIKNNNNNNNKKNTKFSLWYSKKKNIKNFYPITY
jgi:hypothetical protein